MFTAYDKAIAAFLTASLQLLIAFKVGIPGVSLDSLLSIVPFVTSIVTWIVPNKTPDPVPAAASAAVQPFPDNGASG